MGFWSGLGKILGAAGSVAAIPFTGGASVATVLPAILGTAGSVASALGSGRAEGRAVESGLVRNQNQDAVNQAMLELQRRMYALDAPGQRASNAVRGDTLANVQDMVISGLPDRIQSKMGTVTGGLRPSMLSEDTRALGRDMSRQALLQQMQGDQFAPMNLGTYPQSGKVDTLLNTVGTVGSIADAFKGLWNPQNKLPAATNPWTNAVPPKITLPPAPQVPRW